MSRRRQLVLIMIGCSPSEAINSSFINRVSLVAEPGTAEAIYCATSCMGRTHRVSVEGITTDAANTPALLELTLRVNGAHVHRQVEHLCRLHPIHATTPTEERRQSAQRTCSHWSGSSGDGVAFEAETTLYVPEETPTPREKSLNMSEAAAYAVVRRAWVAGLRGPARLFPGQASTATTKSLFSGLWGAATSLPLPFTILETGNLCGHSTSFLARAKQLLCPQCKLVSLDPGNYRKSRSVGRPAVLEALRKQYGTGFDMQQCARRNLEEQGLLNEVNLIDKFGQEAPLSRPPIGFIFYDDGKVRYANAPQQATFEPHIMEGAVVAFHDCLDFREVIVDQAEFLREMVSTGMYEHVSPPPHCFDSGPGSVHGVYSAQCNKGHLEGTARMRKKVRQQVAGIWLHAALLTPDGRQLDTKSVRI